MLLRILNLQYQEKKFLHLQRKYILYNFEKIIEEMKENQNIEFKESWRDEYLKWICGFANAQGGKMYVGVRDNGEVCGVADAKRLMEDIPNKVKDVLGIIVDVNQLKEGELDYIEIVVASYPYPISYKGHYYSRSGHLFLYIFLLIYHVISNFFPLNRLVNF